LLLSGCATAKSTAKGGDTAGIDAATAARLRTDLRPDPTGSGFFRGLARSGGSAVQPTRY
jgi:hypothetical protein